MNIDQQIQDHITTLEKCRGQIRIFCQKVAEYCLATWENGGHVYVCGNGGSAADATHIVGELVGRYRQDRRALRATCLGADFATLTAVSNDYGYDKVFMREVEGKAKQGDLLWCISTSGNSANVLGAVAAAKKIGGVKIIGMSGETGGKLAALCDECLLVPHTMSGRIQEIHEIAYHIICDIIEQEVLSSQ